MPRLPRRLLAPMLVALSMVLAGCHVLDEDGADTTVDTDPGDTEGDETGGDDGTTDGSDEPEDEEDTDDGGDDDGDSTPTPTVTLETYNASVAAGDPINVTWSVSFDDPDAEETTPHTALHWADFSVADPEAPADYGNTTGLHEDVAVPDTFADTFTVDFEGTVYLRAHLIFDGTHHWSDEVTIEVEPGASGGTVHTVSISAVVCSEAPYDPDPVEIAVGDSIQWSNGDGTFDCAHTATSDDDSDYAFDTGNIDTGATSDPIAFTEAGTFAYGCSYHPSMAGTVTVNA